MTRIAFALLAASILAAPASAATLDEAIRADMPQLMTLYRDLHANPELSMQEVRTPGQARGGDAQAWLHRHRKGRQDRRRRGAEEWRRARR